MAQAGSLTNGTKSSASDSTHASPAAPTPAAGTKRKRATEQKFYAVRAGKQPGIYNTWEECLSQVTGFKGASFKAFTTLYEAQAFARGEVIPHKKQSGEMKFYGVQVGKVPGVYLDWPSAQEQIHGVKGPKYKKFGTRAEAEAFVAQGRNKNGRLAAAQLPPEKKRELDMINRSAPGLVIGSTYTAKDVNGNAFEPGAGPLPPGTEDGFDPNIKLNAAGQVVQKTEAEKEKTKLVTKERNPPGMMIIHTDGSSLRNGQIGARAGVGVYFGPSDSRYVPTVSSPDSHEKTLPNPVIVTDWSARHTSTKHVPLNLTRGSRNVSEALRGTRQTNQRAELTAIVKALELSPLDQDVTIYTDSRYSIDCVTNWYRNWVRNKWMTAKNKAVENKDLVMDIRQKIEEREHLKTGTYFVWVKGHANDEGNVAADRLAVEGAMMGRGIDREVEATEDVEKAMAADEMTAIESEDAEVEDAFRAMESAMDDEWG